MIAPNSTCRTASGISRTRFAGTGASTQGHFQAFAGIALPNGASVALHESVGFQPLGINRKVGFKLGAWHDVGWWQKELLAFV